MLSSWAVFIVGLICIVLEGSIGHMFGVESIGFEWSLALTAYVGLRRDWHSSLWILLGWLLPMDWFSGGPGGLHAFGVVVMFWSLRAVASRFGRPWNLGKVLLASLGAGVYHAATALFFVVTAPDSPVLDAILYTAPGAMLMTLLSSVFLGWGLNRVEQMLYGRRGGDGLLLS